MIYVKVVKVIMGAILNYLWSSTDYLGYYNASCMLHTWKSLMCIC